ncbi:hypothetical protein QJS66_13460 [Kocuria rhizophila]|nr:hypothetical protein QJS66_13460 [Kocuria rhizophila]
MVLADGRHRARRPAWWRLRRAPADRRRFTTPHGRLVAAGFFAAAFPGNLAQRIHHRDGLGWTRTPSASYACFQPVLIAAALWSTGALRGRRK